MVPKLASLIEELSARMRRLKAMQEEQLSSEHLTERDVLILGLLHERGRMTVSQIAAAEANASDSTISTNITKLWRDKIVSKTFDPADQRTTIIELTDKGRGKIETVNKQRAERYRKLFEAINVTDDEKMVLMKVLSRAIDFFDKHPGPERSSD